MRCKVPAEGGRPASMWMANKGRGWGGAEPRVWPGAAAQGPVFRASESAPPCGLQPGWGRDALRRGEEVMMHWKKAA